MLLVPLLLGGCFVEYSFPATFLTEAISGRARELRGIFEKAGRTGIKALAKNGPIEVRFQAIWEGAKGDKKRTDQFCNQLEEELHVNVPLRWRECLCNVRAHKEYHFFLVQGGRHYKWQTADGSFGIECDPYPWGQPYRITAVDPRNKRTLWQSWVWGTGMMITTGVHTHENLVVIQKENVLACGVDDHGAYLEVFRRNDGKVLFRFCTCYWNNPSERWEIH